MKSIDCREPLGIRFLDLVFPVDTTPSVARLLPDSVENLTITLPSVCVLDPSVIPACIRSLPKLASLEISLNLSRDNFQPSNRCTAATCSFRSSSGYDLQSASCSFTPRSNPRWQLRFRSERRSIESHPGDGVVDFEREVRQWFELSPVLKYLYISFT